MKNNFTFIREQIEMLNLDNRHVYRDLVNYLDLMAPHAVNPTSSEYLEYKEKFTIAFNELGLSKSHRHILESL